MNKIAWLKDLYYFYQNRNKFRNSKLWVFGCWRGDRYTDNSRYLFEYVRKNLNDIRAVWITNNKSINEKLNKDGYESYLSNEAIGIEIMKNAGVAFFTNSIKDFGDKDYLCGSLKIALFHGVGIKKELRELNYHIPFLRRKLKELKHFIYCDSYSDIICTTSYFMKMKFYEQQYNSSLEKIYVTGQPRNDVFAICNRNYNDEKTILYMPTWREKEKNNIKLEYIIKDMCSSIQLSNLLKEYGYKLIIKPHPMTKIMESPKSREVEIYDGKYFQEIQELLANTDILITDYSSVANDFSLLDRPVIFYAFDLEEHIREGIIDKEYYCMLSNGYVRNNQELIEQLSCILDKKCDYRSRNVVINSFFNDSFLQIGSYSKNVCDVVLKHIGIDKEG